VKDGPGDRILSAQQLIGEYRLAGVGEESIDLPYAITVSITGETIRVNAGCVNIEWGYVMENGDLAALRVPTEGCARGLEDAEEALVEGFDKANSVSRNRANGYDFTGTGPTVTLFTQ
jgi:hypothetical protein